MTTLRQILLSSACALTLGAAGIANAAPTVGTLSGGTTVELDAGFTGALDSLGVGLSLTGNATAGDAGVRFPLTAGEIDVETAAGELIHTGGINLSAPGLTVTLSSFVIDTTTERFVLTGLVKANGDLLFRAPLFEIELPAGFSVPLRTTRLGQLRLSGVGLTLTAEAAGLLNEVFEVEAFVEGFVIGEASVTTRTIPLN